MQDQEVTRICKNIIGLLLQGQFPGNFAPAITESVKFLESLLGQTNEPKEEKAPDSDNNVPDQGGVDNGKVGNPRRKGRKKN